MLLLCFLSQIHPHTHTRLWSTRPQCHEQKQRRWTNKHNVMTPPQSLQPDPAATVPGYQSSPPGHWAATPAGRCLCQCGTIRQAATGKRQHTQRERGGEIQQLFALTADDCPWFWCFSEAENLAQRHAPFHIHSVVFDGSKFRRESRRSSVQRRRDGLTTAPLKQPVP